MRFPGVRNRAARFALPKARRNTIEIQMPACSSHAGVYQLLVSTATKPATNVTTVPCPSEKRHPDQRANRGRFCALNRVKPSMVAR